MSKADEVYYWLKEQFASDVIPIGEKLPSEPELAKRFSSSRPPVRQALARLIHEGLVESRQGKGSFRKRADVPSVASSDIAVILPNLSDYIYPELVEAAGTAIRERGFHALFSCSEGSLAIEADILLKLLERSPRGLIISPICPNPRESSPNQSILLTIKSAGIPILVLDQEWSPLSSLYLDDYEAGREAARYFYDRGHRYCGLCWKAGHRPFYFRAQGYIDECKRLFSTTEPVHFRELVLPAGPEEASSELIAAFLKEAAPQESLPLALFCANDSMALTIRRIALEQGLHIPQDLSIIGFDDSPLVRIKEIDLTSFRYPSRYLGRRAVELLFDHITHRALSPQVTIKIKPPLVERSSVRTIEKAAAPAKEHP